MPRGYADFHLLITQSHDHYSARVITSPVGQATADFVLPFSAEERQRFSWRGATSLRHLALITPQAQAESSQTASSQSASLQTEASQRVPLTLQSFGARLFESVFVGDVGSLFLRSLDAAGREDLILRVRLQFDQVPEVAELPWEYLYSRALARFLALSTRTPLVRFMGLAQPERSLSISLPLRILVVASNPTDLPPLAVEKEWQQVNGAVAGLVQQGRLVLDRLARPTLAELRHWLRREPVHILHFIGHGLFDPAANEGSLFFETESEEGRGRAAPVTSEQLAVLLADHAALRLVFLNSCQGASNGGQESFAGVAQRLVQQGVPSLLAMQFAVSDRAAIALAREFYQALTGGLPLESAVSEVRKAIYSEGEELEWGTPVLFSRSPDGFLLDLPDEHLLEKHEVSMERSATAAAKPWWERIGADDGEQPDLDAIRARGDVIIGIVGAGASDVAVGKNITQQIYKLVGTPTADDAQLVTQALARLNATLAAIQSSADASTMDAGKVQMTVQMAEGYMQLLSAELLKTSEGETPSASTIMLVGNWLLDNLPQLAEALADLFATPAVGRVVGKAGEAAVNWVKSRFM